MKKVLLFISFSCILLSCKKDDNANTVRYYVAGDGIEEIKYNINDVNYSVKKNFANGWDTTFTQTTKQKLQLQAKAKSSTSPNLTGIIYLNGQEVQKQVDDSKDGDGKFDIKIEYQIQ